jgi:hypothetical protein
MIASRRVGLGGSQATPCRLLMKFSTRHNRFLKQNRFARYDRYQWEIRQSLPILELSVGFAPLGKRRGGAAKYLTKLLLSRDNEQIVPPEQRL